MKKNEMLDFIIKNIEFIETYESEPGNSSSWRYTRRPPETTVKVKLHKWVDTDKVLELIKEEGYVFNTDEYNISDIIEDLVLGYNGIVEMERENMLEELRDKHDCVTDIQYQGKSGGYATVIYSFDTSVKCKKFGNILFSDFYDNDFISEVPYNTIKETYLRIKSILKTIDEVHADIEKMKNDLDNYLKNPKNYVEEIISGYCIQ